jgi:hypothetical protein
MNISLFELENIPYWRYETIIEKTNQWFESLKEAKEKKLNNGQQVTTILDLHRNNT